MMLANFLALSKNFEISPGCGREQSRKTPIPEQAPPKNFQRFQSWGSEFLGKFWSGNRCPEQSLKNPKRTLG
jgi:hypothetical protein